MDLMNQSSKCTICRSIHGMSAMPHIRYSLIFGHTEGIWLFLSFSGISSRLWLQRQWNHGQGIQCGFWIRLLEYPKVLWYRHRPSIYRPPETFKILHGGGSVFEFPAPVDTLLCSSKYFSAAFLRIPEALEIFFTADLRRQSQKY